MIFKSMFLKETVKSGSKHYEKKKQNLKGDKSVLHLVSQFHIHAVY